MSKKRKGVGNGSHKPEVSVVTELKQEPKTDKKIAIVGCSQSKSLAPFDNPDFEIWGVNNLYPHIKRATRWFEIHQITKEGDHFYRRGDRKFRGQEVDDYLEQLGKWAVEQNCDVYMQQKMDIIPTSKEYPIQKMIDTFGGYFTNSVSYMIAMAILENYKEIHVYGVDMAVDTEYGWQRPSCEYFLGVAVGRGIVVHIPSEADLLKTRFLYGFQEPQKTAWDKKLKMMEQTMKEKEARINGEINHFQNEITLRKNQLQQYTGAKHALAESNKIWS